MKLTGTVKELEQLIPWDKLCSMIHVDYYKKYLVKEGEIFTVDTEQLPKKLDSGLYRVSDDGSFVWVNPDQTCVPLFYNYDSTFHLSELDNANLTKMVEHCGE